MKKEKTILCVIPDYDGKLPIRGGIHAPIHRPSPFTLKEIIMILNERIKIYAVVNKNNKKEQILLTYHNVNDPTLFTKETHLRKRSVIKHVRAVASPENINGKSSKRGSVVGREKEDNLNRNAGKVLEEITRPDFF